MNNIGQELRAAKSAGGDATELLANLGVAKKTLEDLVRPRIEAATAAGDTDLREALMPAFEKVMTKSERKKRAKELKKRQQAAAGGGGGGGGGSSAKPGSAAGKGGKKNAKNAKNASKQDKNKNNKKKNNKKGKGNKGAASAASAVVRIYDDPKLSKNQLFLDVEPSHIADGTLRACIAAGLRAGIQFVPRLVQQGKEKSPIVSCLDACFIIALPGMGWGCVGEFEGLLARVQEICAGCKGADRIYFSTQNVSLFVVVIIIITYCYYSIIM